MEQYSNYRPGVDFLSVEQSEKFKEIALSIFAIRGCPTFLHKFEAKKFDDTAKERKSRMRNRPRKESV